MVATRQIDGRTVTFRHEVGTGPALVCVHGSADNQHVYDRLLDAIPGRERYAINLPGRAGTDGPPLDDVAAMEAFLARFLESEVKGEYLIVGHSLGGAIAIEHALAGRSDRLAGIVLLATGARLRVHPMILQLFEQVAKSGSKIPPLPPGLYEPDTEPNLVAQASKDRELTPIESAGADWQAANSFDRMQDIGQIEVPAMIVAGTEDALTPLKYAQYMDTRLPRSELHVIDGGGHMLVMERVEELANWIERFAR